MRKPFLPMALLLLYSYSSAQVNYNTKPLDGFKIMALPRDYMPIGALWNLKIGPIGDGASPDLVINSSSVSNLDLSSDQNTKSNLELGIFSFLKAGGNYEALTNAQLSLENLTIVTLNSIDILKNNVGQHILYEALKVGAFKITVDKSRVADAKLNLTQIFKNKVDFGAQTDINNKTTIDISGVNLHLAYRVIKIESENKKTTTLKFKSQSQGRTNSFTISSRYEAVTPTITVQICPCNIIGCMIDNGYVDRNKYGAIMGRCASQIGYDLTVILNNEVDMSTGMPRQYYFKVKSGSDIRNYNQSLYVKPTSQGIEVSYIAFEKIIFDPFARMENTYLIRMLSRRNDQKAALVTQTFKFRNIVPQVPGW